LDVVPAQHVVDEVAYADGEPHGAAEDIRRPLSGAGGPFSAGWVC
jgi:hypothetical protein